MIQSELQVVMLQHASSVSLDTEIATYAKYNTVTYMTTHKGPPLAGILNHDGM